MTLAIKVLALICAIVWSASLATAREESFDAGKWTGVASLDSQTGTLEYCSIAASYNSGVSLAIGLEADFRLYVILYNPAWSLADGASFPLTLFVDRRWSRSVTGLSVAPDGVIIDLSDDLAAFDTLRRGQMLTVQAARESFEFLLTGTSYALAETAKCVLVNSASIGDSDPFSVNSDPFATRARTTQQSADQITAGEVSAFLASAGIQSATMMTENERKEYLPNMKFAWAAGDHMGGLVQVDLAGRSPRGIVNDEIAGISGVCQGKFGSYIQSEESFGDATLVRFATACNDGQTPFVTAGSLVAGSGAAILFEHIGASSAVAAIKNTDDLVAAAIKTLYQR